MTLIPYLGRDYASIREVKDAFHAGNDFTVADISSRWDGKPANKEDLLKDGITAVNIRYAKLRKIAVVKLDEQWPPPEKKPKLPKLVLATPDPEG